MATSFPLLLSTTVFAVLTALVSVNLIRLFNSMLRFPETWSKVHCATLLPAALRKRLNAWGFLLYGPDYISNGYATAGGKPYEVLVPEARYVVVPPGQYFDEVNRAKESELSLYAASKQMFMPGYTMHGFNWHDIRGKESIGFNRVFRGLSRQQLPLIIPDLQAVISQAIEEEMVIASRYVKGTRQTAVYPMLLRVVAHLNSSVFFGHEATSDKDFLEAAINFIEDVLKSAELLRILPKFMLPILGGINSRRFDAQARLFDHLKAIVEKRLESQDSSRTYHDCVQWIIDGAPKKNPWSAERIVHEVMATWFGALHSLSISLSFATIDLCAHSEHVEHLRAELESSAFTTFLDTAHGLPFMDSFIKESARITPFEAISVRRRALEDFPLSDGTVVAKGDWVVTPLRALNHDATLYNDPASFDPFRFVKQQPEGADISSAESESLFTDPTATWQFWGGGKILCPGRFYSATAIKLILAHLLTNFDMELVNKDAPRSWNWRTTINPRKDVRVVFAPRAST